ncbi:MAG: MarR family transcriptional regulator [Actinomycetota bacterium]|nr:MarR family transcriptional regulator [Actinomycetota bacterium]
MVAPTIRDIVAPASASPTHVGLGTQVDADAAGSAMAVDATDPAVRTIDAAIEAVSYVATRARVHERLVRRAGVALDRAGSVVLGHLACQDGLRVGELAAILGVDAPTVTRKVQHLEREGWVRRSPDPNDRRAHRLHVTARGHQVLQRLLAARRSSLTEVLAGWDRADRDRFAELFQRFVSDVLHHHEADR